MSPPRNVFNADATVRHLSCSVSLKVPEFGFHGRRSSPPSAFPSEGGSKMRMDDAPMSSFLSLSRTLEAMRVRVDTAKCQGHNRCYALAPELFDVDDYGNAHELNDGVVPAGLEDKARLALANCPEYAISIEE